MQAIVSGCRQTIVRSDLDDTEFKSGLGTRRNFVRQAHLSAFPPIAYIDFRCLFCSNVVAVIQEWLNGWRRHPGQPKNQIIREYDKSGFQTTR